MSDYKSDSQPDMQKYPSPDVGEIKPETKPETTSPARSETGLSPRGVAAMQNQPETSEVKKPETPDKSFQDTQGRDITLRDYPSGDTHYIRAFDAAKTSQPPDQIAYGDAGRMNLRMEKDASGKVERAKAQDIETMPTYRNSGIGSKMLEMGEGIARKNNAREIYGLAPDDKVTQEWYQKRGYRFRDTDQGKQVFKILTP